MSDDDEINLDFDCSGRTEFACPNCGSFCIEYCGDGEYRCENCWKDYDDYLHYDDLVHICPDCHSDNLSISENRYKCNYCGAHGYLESDDHCF